MGQCQFRRVHDQLVVGQQIEVDGTVVVPVVDAFMGSSQCLFNVLRQAEHFEWGELGLYLGHSIQEGVGGVESPGHCLIKRRAIHAQTYLCVNCSQGRLKVGCPVT